MASVSNPTLRRRELGVRLREHRTRAGLTVDQVAERLMSSTSKISRMETAQRAVSARDVRDLCDIYEVDPLERERLLTLVRESKQRGWWHNYEDLGTGIDKLIGLQDAAVEIKDYESCIVPSLLQTETYARAAIRGILPEISDAVLEERVEARLLRQKLLLKDDAPRFWALLDESVLHRHIGGIDGMKAQLERVLELGSLPNVTIQVIPYRVGAHPGLDSTFVFMRFAEVSPIIFVEGLVGYIFLDRESDISRYQEALTHLHSAALNPADSLDFISSAAHQL